MCTNHFPGKWIDSKYSKMRYIVFFYADLFTESRTLRKRRQPNSTVTVTERRRKPVTVSDIL